MIARRATEGPTDLEEPTDSSEAESSEAEDFCESEAGLREGAELHNHIVSAAYTEGETNLLRSGYIHRRLCLTWEDAIALRMQLLGGALGWLQPNFNVLEYTFESRKNSCVPLPSINPLSNSCPEDQLITSRPPSRRWPRPPRLACSIIQKYISVSAPTA